MSVHLNDWRASIAADYFLILQTQVTQQAILHVGLNISMDRLYTEMAQICDLQITEPTGVNAREWFEVDLNIQRHAVETGAAPHPESDTRDLAGIDINARRVFSSNGFDAKACDKIDNTLFKPGDEITHTQFRPLQVDQRVNH